MTSPPEEIQVCCPKHGLVYENLFERSVNFGLGNAQTEEVNNGLREIPKGHFEESPGI